MALHEGRALVLDITDYRETSSLVRLFTETEGRISLVARGLRKAKTSGGTGALQPFNLVRIRYFLKEGSTIGNLAGADLERLTSAPRNSLEAYALISYWFEILRETAQPREASSDIFELSVQVIDTQERNAGLSLCFLTDLVTLCKHLGFGLNWTHCVTCGNAAVLKNILAGEGSQQGAGMPRFSLAKGGVTCSQCADQGEAGIRLTPPETAIINALAGRDDLNPKVESPTALLDFLGLINRYLIYHLEHGLKTFSFLENTLSP